MREPKRVDLAHMLAAADWQELVEEVCATNQQLMLRANGKDVAVLSPVSPPSANNGGRPVTADDALSLMIGSVTDASPSGASMKREYLAKAFAAKCR